MASETHYLRAVIPSLPTEIAQKIRSLCVTPANEIMLENLVRFIAGGDPASDSSKTIQEQWSEKQIATKKVLTTLIPASDKKRAREEDIAQDEDSQTKKPRLSPPTKTANGNEVTPSGPLYTLHSLSATSPVRKKVDITIHKNAITMTHPTSRAVESVLPLSIIKRAFIVPTRGKSKPHWTVILLSSDVPAKSKPGAPTENQQVIFGVDATATAPFTTTSYTDDAEPAVKVSPKGTETLPFLEDFLKHLDVPVIQPSPEVFRSVCPGIGASASAAGIPGVEAYRAAKGGNLWFSKEGILWGESKPCEFWPVDSLLGRAEGLRVIGSGRTCTVVLTRRSAPGDETGNGENEEEEEEDVGEESEFGMVDAKEREGINEWVRNHRHLFGKTSGEKEGKKEEETVKVQNQGPITIRTLMNESDSEDEDFSTSVSDLDGSERSTDDESSSEEAGSGDEGDDDMDAEAGSDKEGGDENDVEEEGDEHEKLDPARHPLLRPGAMPKMSKAALEMAVGIVEEAFVGGAGQGHDELDEDEEDELDD